MASSNRRASSSGLAGLGESFVTRCCGSVPSTSAGMSALVYPTAFKPFGTARRSMNQVMRSASTVPASAGETPLTEAPRAAAACR